MENDSVNSNTTNADNQDSNPVKVIDGFKAEMIQERKKRQELEKKLEAYEAEKKTKQDKELLEQGKLQELLTAREKELESLKPRIALADEYEALQKAEIESIKKQLDSNWDESFNLLPLSALRKLVKTPIKVPDTESGNSKGDITKKTPLELQLEQAINNNRPTYEIIALKRQIEQSKK